MMDTKERNTSTWPPAALLAVFASDGCYAVSKQSQQIHCFALFSVLNSFCAVHEQE